MTDTTVEVQQEIFDQSLTGDDLKAVNALVNQHRGNAALTQQLAVDASRLITTSQERLEKQAGSGFFKRFASKISGKTSENQLQNQVDMLQMQKYAWHYLKQLQQQNLINAQSIAVIRNNLGEMNGYIIETRDFLEEAVDKINRRLQHVENNTSFSSWSLNIEANKRRYKSMPSTLLILELTFDFMRKHREVMLTSRDINHLVVTLDKLGVNCDDEIELLEFIIELIDQIEVAGIERYRAMTELSFDNHLIDSHFIQKNISGIAFNSLYFLSEQYEKIIDLTGDGDLCNSDEAREKIISKLFGSEFSGLNTTYGIRDLIEEVIGGSLLAIDIYKDVNGLNETPEEEDEQDEPETLSLTSSLPDIRSHSFIDKTESDEARRNYLHLFALCIENSATLNKSGQEFLALLSEKAGRPQLVSEVIGIADSPHKTHEYLPVLQALLKDDDDVYTWLLDAFFLLTICQKKIENPQVARILATLKPAQFKENFPHLLAVINGSDEALVIDAATKLSKRTQGWKNIVQYRELRFDQTFGDIKKKLYSACIDASSLGMDIMTATSKASDYSYFMGSFDGDSLLGKFGSAVGGSAYALGRSSSLSSLNDMRKKVQEFIAKHSTALYEANALFGRLNIPRIEFNDNLAYSNYELDNSATNDDWYQQYSDLERQLDDTLTAFRDACSDADDQLGFLKNGEFDKSVIAIKAQNHAARLLEKQQEKLSKQSVVIEQDGREHLFSIEWQQVDNPPCDPEKIRHIKTDGKVWLIVDDDGGFYRSEDRKHWQLAPPDASNDNLYVRKLDIVDGIWILMVGYDEGFYYSSDALTWRQSQFPERPSSFGFSRTEDVVRFNGLWLWRFTERTEYQYTDKGFLFDSTKTSSYDKSVIFCTESLDAAWQRWDGTPNFAEGVVVESIRSLPGVACLLVFCKYNYLYKMVKKKTSAESFVSYYLPGKSWRECTWASDNDYYSDIVVARMNETLMCFYSNQLLTSDKGFDWKPRPTEMYIRECFHLENVSLFPSQHNGQVIYLSQDGKEFKEVMLDEGNWQYACANDQGILSVYSPDSHETFLRSGHFICQPKT
jgi:hypothetical protein